MISYLDMKEFINQKGYSIEKEFFPNVLKVNKGAQIHLAKFDYTGISTKQAKRENNMYLKYGNLEGIPEKINFFDNISEEIKKEENFMNHILFKKFIPGEHYAGETIGAKEEQKMFDLIKFFNKEKYYVLDIASRNFILTPERKLYFIDFSTEFGITNVIKDYDLTRLEKMFRGN